MGRVIWPCHCFWCWVDRASSFPSSFLFLGLFVSCSVFMVDCSRFVLDFSSVQISTALFKLLLNLPQGLPMFIYHPLATRSHTPKCSSQWEPWCGLDITKGHSWHLCRGWGGQDAMVGDNGCFPYAHTDPSQSDLLLLLISWWLTLVDHMAEKVSSKTCPKVIPMKCSMQFPPIFYHYLPFWMSHLKSLQGNVALFEWFHLPPTNFPFVPVFVWPMNYESWFFKWEKKGKYFMTSENYMNSNLSFHK